MPLFDVTIDVTATGTQVHRFDAVSREDALKAVHSRDKRFQNSKIVAEEIEIETIHSDMVAISDIQPVTPPPGPNPA
jgi:hypothetical protein